MPINRNLERLGETAVLLADDEGQVVKLVESVLFGLGIKNILRASDGAQAIETFGSYAGKIGLVICDWNMPEATGLDVLKFVRSSGQDVPFIMLTGKSTRDAVVAAKEFGVDAYVRKPFSIGEIEGKVLKLLQLD